MFFIGLNHKELPRRLLPRRPDPLPVFRSDQSGFVSGRILPSHAGHHTRKEFQIPQTLLKIISILIIVVIFFRQQHFGASEISPRLFWWFDARRLAGWWSWCAVCCFQQISRQRHWLSLRKRSASHQSRVHTDDSVCRKCTCWAIPSTSRWTRWRWTLQNVLLLSKTTRDITSEKHVVGFFHFVWIFLLDTDLHFHGAVIRFCAHSHKHSI